MHIAGEDFYRFLVEQSREILCYHDATGKNIFVSPAMKYLCGFEPEEVTGKNPYDFIHPDDWDYVQRFGHMPALTGTEVTIFEYRFRKKEGGYIWLQTLLQPIKGPDGAVQRLISSSRDITQEVELRELLKRNETLLDEACRMASIGAWEYHPDNQSMVWSKIVYDIHEVDISFKPTYENCFQFFPEPAQEKLQALLKDSIERGVSYDVVLPSITAKQNQRWVRLITRPEIRYGKVFKLYGVVQDVTKPREDQNRLQQMVQFLTQQKKQLENFNQIISHNFRGPIGNLGTLATYLAKETNPATREEYVTYIKESSDQLLDELNSLVDMVKATKHEDVKREPVSIKSEVNKVCALLRGDIIRLKANIKVDNSAWDSIEYSPIYLESILMNLISNSLKYSSPDRKPHIIVRTGFNNNLKTLQVEDNGLGVDLESCGKDEIFKLHRVFHPQVPGAKGLGLFMTRNQVESMGGSITVDSVPGEGTSFTITFDTYKNAADVLDIGHNAA